jgi:RNA polymerase sigma factor (sigma-70 family)
VPMEYARRVDIFRRLKTDYAGFLTSVLWRLTGDRELFSEALQYAMLEMWRHVEKLDGKKAGAYIYRIALSANSKAWRNRIGKNGQLSQSQLDIAAEPQQKNEDVELIAEVRKAIARLPAKQSAALVMRYLQQQDYGTIADKLSCAEDTARSYVSKAINTLRNNLTEMNISES